MKILVPDTIQLDLAELRKADAELDPVGYRVAEPIPDEHVDAEVLVAWSNPPGPLADAARRLTKLRWVQDLAAGPGVTLQAGFPAEVVITSGRSLHDRTVAEHALALTLAAARHLHVAVRAQRSAVSRRAASAICAGGFDQATSASASTCSSGTGSATRYPTGSSSAPESSARSSGIVSGMRIFTAAPAVAW